MAALKDLTLDQVMQALPKLVKDDVEGTYVYNVTIDGDDPRVADPKAYVVVTDGVVEAGVGHSDAEGATEFTVNQGGVDTLIAFQTHGMKAATSAMMMGYIFTNNIKKAEMWFKIFKIGPEAMIAALAENGITIDNQDLDIYEELMLN